MMKKVYHVSMCLALAATYTAYGGNKKKAKNEKESILRPSHSKTLKVPETESLTYQRIKTVISSMTVMKIAMKDLLSRKLIGNEMQSFNIRIKKHLIIHTS